jgi:hypothetical protein
VGNIHDLYVQQVLANLGNTSLAERLMASGLDPTILRPFQHDNRSWITVNVGTAAKPEYKTIITNAPAILRREDWLVVDKTVQMQAKKPLVFANDVFAANTVTIPNAMGKLAIQHTLGDGDADAIVSMDPIRTSERSKPVFDAVHLPLPVTHSDNNFSLREVLVSRNGGMALDTNGIARASRKCGEVTEEMFLGTTDPYTFGGGTIYGALNFPQRMTVTITSPENGSWTPALLNSQLVYLMKLLADDEYPGPYNVYVSREWVPHLNLDYSAQYPNLTVRSRLLQNEGISSIKTVPYLTGFRLLMIQMTSDVIEGINGMDFVPVQWTEKGGMELFLKIMGIKIPRLRYDYNGNTGIIDATAVAPTSSTTTTTTTT